MNSNVINLLNQSLFYLRNENLNSAEFLLKSALKYDAKNAEVMRLLGVVYAKKDNYLEALAFFEKALKVDRQNGILCSNIGNVLQSLRRPQEALAYYQKAISLQPEYAEAYNNCGNALQELKRHQEALAYYQKAISLQPEYAEAYNNCGNALQELKRHQEALNCYQKAFDVNSNVDFLLGSLVYTKMKICDWSNYSEDLERLSNNILIGRKTTLPFQTIALYDSEEFALRAAITFGSRWLSSQYKFPARQEKIGKIKIGYFSADFHNHATMYLMAEFFELLNHDKFEITAFSFGEGSSDESRSRLLASVDEFIDVKNLTTDQIVNLARDKGIDIAVDLKGYTEYSRPEVFFRRVAPIQLSYLGYPGGMGCKSMDYIMADRVVIPESNQKYFLEKIIYLPHCYQVNDRTKKIADVKFSKSDLGLPERAFVFCCFNNNYKITPSTLDSWSRILSSVHGSVLWLLEDNEWATKNLIKEFSQRGILKTRLIFAKRISLDEHLARHSQANLFLDTLPCNAHTTASDALWMGLPVITQMGSTFAGRVCASLLNAIDLPDLIASTVEEYENLAVDLALNPDKMRAVKTRLDSNKNRAPLFNTRLTTNMIEKAYIEIYNRYLEKLPPDHIYIE